MQLGSLILSSKRNHEHRSCPVHLSFVYIHHLCCRTLLPIFPLSLYLLFLLPLPRILSTSGCAFVIVCHPGCLSHVRCIFIAFARQEKGRKLPVGTKRRALFLPSIHLMSSPLRKPTAHPSTKGYLCFPSPSSVQPSLEVYQQQSLSSGMFVASRIFLRKRRLFQPMQCHAHVFAINRSR